MNSTSFVATVPKSEIADEISHVGRGYVIAYLAAATAFASVLLLSSMYCLLAYIPTTYFAFIQAPFQAWMPAFAKWQPYLFAATFFGIAIPVFTRFRRSTAKRLMVEFLFIGWLASFYLFLAHPVQLLRNSSASFIWAIAFLLPVLLLGALECTVALPGMRERQQEQLSFSYMRVVLAAIFVAIAYPGAAYLRYYMIGGDKSLTESDAIEWLWAVTVHILLFVFVFSVVAFVGKLASRAAKARRAHFVWSACLTCVGLGFVLKRVVLASIPFTGTEAVLYSVAFSLATTTFTVGCVLYARTHLQRLSSDKSIRKRRDSAVLWLFLLAAALTVPALIGAMDWNSVLEKTWAVAYWAMVSVVVVYRSPKPDRKGFALPVIAAVLCLLAFRVGKQSEQRWAHMMSGFGTTTALEHQSAIDASFLAASELLMPASERPCNEQCEFIQQQTNIPASASVNLRNIDLVRDLRPTPGKKPNIFIIVVDSLRQDYISAYNPAVFFTPNIGGFARDSVVFRNAFTRYAGTTLSEPSIWSGMMQLHKHYVQPFHLVNGLEKLIETDDYQSFITVDTVLRVLLQPQQDTVELDKAAPKWTNVDFCSTAAEATAKLQARRDIGRPIFLYTQPQNIHIVTLGETTRIRPPKKDYAPFVSYYASELERLDGCFGSFIQKLKTMGLYDDSVVVLTSDHGEDLKTFGPERHAFSLKPNVIRIPLIVHVPKEIKRTWFSDPDEIAFNTDITPTLYELLGHGPVVSRPEFGRPLFTQTGEEMKKYRRESYMVASSYGPLYGLLSDDGRTAFTENEASGVEEFFRVDGDPSAARDELTDDIRQRGETQLHADIAEIAGLYGYLYKPASLLDWLMR